MSAPRSPYPWREPGGSITPVVLGIDTQTTRIGLAAVELEAPHRGVAAWTFSLREGGSLGEQVRQSLVIFAADLPADCEVSRVGIERGVVFRAGRDYLWDAGGVYHLAAYLCDRRWPHAPILPRRAKEWKLDALGDGNASKAAILAWATDRCRADGWDERALEGLTVKEADGADALAIALSAALLELAPPARDENAPSQEAAA